MVWVAKRKRHIFNWCQWRTVYREHGASTCVPVSERKRKMCPGWNLEKGRDRDRKVIVPCFRFDRSIVAREIHCCRVVSKLRRNIHRSQKRVRIKVNLYRKFVDINRTSSAKLLMVSLWILAKNGSITLTGALQLILFVSFRKIDVSRPNMHRSQKRVRIKVNLYRKFVKINRANFAKLLMVSLWIFGKKWIHFAYKGIIVVSF